MRRLFFCTTLAALALYMNSALAIMLGHVVVAHPLGGARPIIYEKINEEEQNK